MLKNTLLLALVSCTLLVSVQAWADMKERLKNRVIHVETLLKRGRWLWQNDNKDGDGSRYLYIDELPERDTYYTPRVQFQTTECGSGKYLCLESLSLQNYYLTAGFPAGATKYTVKLQYSVYTEDDNRFHWKIMCESNTLDECKFVPIRFESDGYLMIADNWGSEEGYAGGHYDATLGKDEGLQARFRVHAPNPTDGQIEIYGNTNEGDHDQAVKYSTTIGVSQTSGTSHEITQTTSIEIGGAFKGFSASTSSTISESWTFAESSTYEAAKTVEHGITLPARTRVILKQLKGDYDKKFTVGKDEYTIIEEPLDDGPTRTRKIQFAPGTTREKEEL